MNQTERRMADLLTRRSDVVEWWFEEWTFKLGPDCRYTPDFVALLTDGRLEVIEVKGGFVRDDAKAKFRIAAGRYPLIFRFAVWQKNTWTITTPFAEDR